MKLRLLQLSTAALLTLCAGSSNALIVLGDSGGTNIYTSAPADDPGWDNVGYVRSMWNTSRASGVYIGDGWVLCSYHEIYFDGPTGIVFNAEPGTPYPIDVSSYVRLDTNSFMRLADSPDWIPPQQVYPDYSTDYERGTNWNSLASQFAPTGADIAMFRLQEGHYPDIKSVQISTIPKSSLPSYINGGFYLENGTLKYRFPNPSVTAIATGRPRQDELSYWTTNWTDWAKTGEPLTNAPYSGYEDWPDKTYNPICRWGQNNLHSTRTTLNRAPFGSTICLQSIFNDYENGGNSNTFQMARLDSGGGVFYKGSGQWELLGLLTAKQPPDNEIETIDTAIHPFGSYSWICDLSYYREQIMNVTEWPDLSVQLLNATNSWLEIGQPVTFSIIITNATTNAVPTAFTNTIELLKNGQTHETFQIEIPALDGGGSYTHVYSFTNNSPGIWEINVIADSENQVYETHEQTAAENDQGVNQNNEIEKDFYVGPDLIIENSSPAETNLAAGSPVSIDIAIKNQGANDATNSFQVGLYVFAEKPGTTPYWQTKLSPLTAGTSATVTAHFSAPTNTGSYFIVAKADDYDSKTEEDAVKEAQENNNQGDLSIRASYSILHVGPDLAISFTQTNTLRTMAGTTVNIYCDIANNGSGSGIPIENVLQLSTNKAFTAFSEVATNTTVDSTLNKLFQFEAPREPGIYYLRAQTDPLNSIFEFNEANNFSQTIMLNVTPLAMPWLNLLLK